MAPPVQVTAVVGAGYLGRAVARAVPGPVLATTRRGAWSGGGPAPDHVTVAALELGARAEAGRELMAGMSAAVLCVAPRAGAPEPYTHAARLPRWLAPGARAVWISSTSAAAHRDGDVDEHTPGPPEGPRGELQRRAEAHFWDACAEAGVHGWVLRLGGLYGPGRSLGGRALARDGPLPGDGWIATNLIHRDDAVAAILAALGKPERAGVTVHVCAADHTPRRELYARAARARGLPPPRWQAPTPAGPPRGKRVASVRMRTLLDLTPEHDTHWLGADPESGGAGGSYSRSRRERQKR